MTEQETTTSEVEIVTPYAMAEAIKKVMRWTGKPNRWLILGKDLIAEGGRPSDIERIYGEGGVYWYEDWRGQRGQKPHATAIRETFIDFLHAGPVARPAAQPKSAGALAEYMQRTGATMGRSDNG